MPAESREERIPVSQKEKEGLIGVSRGEWVPGEIRGMSEIHGGATVKGNKDTWVSESKGDRVPVSFPSHSSSRV